MLRSFIQKKSRGRGKGVAFIEAKQVAPYFLPILLLGLDRNAPALSCIHWAKIEILLV
jgi:hypothetical protein